MAARSTPHSATLCAHAGVPRSLDSSEKGPQSHVSPLYQISVFDFPSIESSLPALGGDGYVYRRHGVPNTDELGAAVAALEGAEAGLSTGSGMAAIAAVMFALCESGDRVVVQRDAYGGTRGLFDHDLARAGVAVTYVDAYDAGAVEVALDGARVLMVETVSNPLLREVDVSALAAHCSSRGATLVVDNTFSTPLRDRPLDHGAHLVVHSATKFLGGHHDLSAGIVAGGSELVRRAAAVALRMGLGAAPFDAWLAVRGIRTLDVRMRRAWATAAELVIRLERHAAVRAVHHAPRCALVTFDVGDYAGAERFVKGLSLLTLSPSLGGVTTTVSHPATSSHRSVPPDERSAAGIGDGLVRISVGVEDLDDIWRDLDGSLVAG